MSIDTTINIDKDTLQLLKNAGKKTGMTKSEIIQKLLLVSIKKTKFLPKKTRNVKYQTKRNYSDWKNVHITLNDENYEILTDIRKVVKISVSFFVSEIINKYITDLLYNRVKNNNFAYNYCPKYLHNLQYEQKDMEFIYKLRWISIKIE